MRQIVVFLLVATTCMTSDGHAEGFDGTICLRTGKCIDFKHFGKIDDVRGQVIEGYLDGQKVTIDVSDLSEVIFSRTYPQSRQIIVVNKEGERFTMERAWNCSVQRGKKVGCGGASYVYQDRITGKLSSSFAVSKDILSFSIGHSGAVKRNTRTGEFFPSIYNYDPFTGEELEWADKP